MRPHSTRSMVITSATLTVLLTAAALVAVPIERGSAAAASPVSATGGLVSPASALTFTNKTTANGLPSNFLYGVYAVDDTVYAATDLGLSISTNGGASFTTYTISDGLGDDDVYGVYAVGNTVYAATPGGLSVSTNLNATPAFTNYTTGLGMNVVAGVYATDDTVYAATYGGLSISTNGGTSFTNYTTGLGSNFVNGVSATVDSVYAATSGGLSISTNGGTSFTNRTTGGGLGSNDVYGVYGVGSTVYAAANGGLSISTNSGATFSNRTFSGTLPNRDLVTGVYAVGSMVYVATFGGMQVSTNGGATFTNYTTTNTAGGLGSNGVNGVSATDDTVYAATSGGLSIAAAPQPPALVASPNPISVVVGDAGTVTISSTDLPVPNGTSVTAVSANTGVATVASPVNASGGDAAFTVTGVSAGTVNVTFSASGYTNVVVPVTVTALPPSPPPVSPPSAPASVSGVAGDGSAVLSWTAPASAGSFPISNYQAVVSAGGQSCLVSVPAVSCTISGLTNGTTYTATVRALNGAGWGPSSATSSAFTPQAPATPSITITGSRGEVRSRPGVIVSGTSTGFGMGAILRPWVKLAGQATYRQGSASVLVDATGGFTWQRTMGRKAYVYVAAEDGSVQSNRVIIAVR